MDTTGEHHGFLAKLYRMVENFGDMESKHLREYQAELLADHFLLAVDVPEENDRARLLDVFKGHDQNGIRLLDAPL